MDDEVSMSHSSEANWLSPGSTPVEGGYSSEGMPTNVPLLLLDLRAVE